MILKKRNSKEKNNILGNNYQKCHKSNESCKYPSTSLVNSKYDKFRNLHYCQVVKTPRQRQNLETRWKMHHVQGILNNINS
jgi:hypothetical protein